ncbi:hypothetical protein [Streptomyces nitrosporeus]|nr:hypothetical protein [Streptomyces nitrosporeus]GGY85035.1 hypothetical protein GCM10010327_14340 [Streptomyces nitrosporeus]
MRFRGASRAGMSLEPPPGYYGVCGNAPDAERRGLILDWVVNRRIATGWRVESRSGSQAVLVRGQPVNHVLHALLALLSCGLWAVAWAGLSVVNKVERIALTVDAQGQVVTVRAP